MAIGFHLLSLPAKRDPEQHTSTRKLVSFSTTLRVVEIYNESVRAYNSYTKGRSIELIDQLDLEKEMEVGEVVTAISPYSSHKLHSSTLCEESLEIHLRGS